MSTLKHIIFDLDNTLWDFSGNSKRILAEIYDIMALKEKGIHDFEKFHHQYKFRNEYLWREYAFGNVTREAVRLNRFYITFNDFGVDDKMLAHAAADHYISNTRNQKDLLPHTVELLEYLQKKYQLHIITNGFEEVQFFKLNNTGIRKYFASITTAEAANALKPDIRIFNYALNKIPAQPSQCVYIGDSPDVDGTGAKNAGMDFIWVNTEEKENTFQYKMVAHLSEIEALL